MKSNQFAQFFLVRGKSGRIDKIFAESSGFRPEKQNKKFHYLPLILGKKTILSYFCQLEIDHVTQKPKETCQSTCGGPESTRWGTNFFTVYVMYILDKKKGRDEDAKSGKNNKQGPSCI